MSNRWSGGADLTLSIFQCLTYGQIADLTITLCFIICEKFVADFIVYVYMWVEAFWHLQMHYFIIIITQIVGIHAQKADSTLTWYTCHFNPIFWFFWKTYWWSVIVLHVVGLKVQEKELEADYEIGVVLGNGGFGTVYAGSRRRDGKRVSLRDILSIQLFSLSQ